jgi:uncharacterized protein (DUF58 family)
MAAQIHYRIAWRSRTAFPGAHASTQSGGGQEFSHHVPLIDAPDSRRLDLHASLKDPFGNWLVRRFRQRSGVNVYVVADLSASMGFAGTRRKLDVLADLAAALAYSAHHAGDRFGFIGCDQRVREDWYWAAGQRAGAGLELSAALRGFTPHGTSADALPAAAAYLARQRSLVFLVSDFHFPWATLDAVLAAYARHQLVPVVVWDRAEFADLPRWGLARLRDSESGRTRLVALTPGFGAALRTGFAERGARLQARCMQHNARPLFLLDGFDADLITAYFYGVPRAGAIDRHADPLDHAHA